MPRFRHYIKLGTYYMITQIDFEKLVIGPHRENSANEENMS